MDRDKVAGYLLNQSHPDGAAKWRFFSAFGFTARQWSVLAEALRTHALSNPVVAAVESPFGMRYTVEGPLETPDGRRPIVFSVWIVDRGTETPRLVTAYPARGR